MPEATQLVPGRTRLTPRTAELQTDFSLQNCFRIQEKDVHIINGFQTFLPVDSSLKYGRPDPSQNY